MINSINCNTQHYFSDLVWYFVTQGQCSTDYCFRSNIGTPHKNRFMWLWVHKPYGSQLKISINLIFFVHFLLYNNTITYGNITIEFMGLALFRRVFPQTIKFFALRPYAQGCHIRLVNANICKITLLVSLLSRNEKDPTAKYQAIVIIIVCQDIFYVTWNWKHWSILLPHLTGLISPSLIT